LECLFFLLCMYKYIIQVTNNFRVVHNSLDSEKRGAAKHNFLQERVNVGNQKGKMVRRGFSIVTV
jgi:hypothetical protein